MAILEFNGPDAGEIKRHPEALERWMIRFVGLPFVFASGEGRPGDAAKPEMIRSVEVTIFSGVQ